MNRKSSPLATRSKELKGTALGAGIEQLNRFASRQTSLFTHPGRNTIRPSSRRNRARSR